MKIPLPHATSPKHCYTAALVACALSALPAHSATDNLPLPADTLPAHTATRPWQRITASPAWRITGVGVPMVAGGLLLKGSDRHVRRLRNAYAPTFHNTTDNYLQYLPAAVMVGMKIGGVEGRSSWGRMLLSDAFAAVIMTSAVRLTKMAAQVERPDGGNRHSFPSGHTATAFMAATMMSKEYGGRSPWYSIGAYTVATATGVMRIANNRHWASDVVAGAGIGIVSTELGYYLADLMFKDKGVRTAATDTDFDRWARPSSASIGLGRHFVTGSHALADGTPLHLGAGTAASVEGAWFASPYWGAGAQLTAAYATAGRPEDAATLNMSSARAGAYASYPLTPRLLAGGKLLAGYTHYAACQLPEACLGGNGAFSLSTGLAVTFRARRHLAAALQLDYALAPPPAGLQPRWLHTLTLGATVGAAF